jgi:two-component system response regulator GlrR
MKDRSWDPGTGQPSWLHAEMKDAFEGANILVVEDDDDIRELMVTLLKLAGFSPTACGTAEQGLEELREQTFDLVLTDYALPNRTGAWLLHQASLEGLMDVTPAFVVTAHPNPPDVPGFEIIQKPFDLDDLVERVRRRLEGGGDSRLRNGGVRKAAPGRPGDNQRGDCPDPIELILYVSANSPRSATAIANIKKVLAGYKAGQVTLTICDLAKDPLSGSRDSVAFTPTLVKRSPGPRTFILGHLSNPELLLELLEGCEPAGGSN